MKIIYAILGIAAIYIIASSFAWDLNPEHWNPWWRVSALILAIFWAAAQFVTQKDKAAVILLFVFLSACSPDSDQSDLALEYTDTGILSLSVTSEDSAIIQGETTFSSFAPTGIPLEQDLSGQLRRLEWDSIEKEWIWVDDTIPATIIEPDFYYIVGPGVSVTSSDTITVVVDTVHFLKGITMEQFKKYKGIR